MWQFNCPALSLLYPPGPKSPSTFNPESHPRTYLVESNVAE